MPRKTDSKHPADWLWLAGSDLKGVSTLAEKEIGYSMCRSKLAEVLEKILKAELIRLGWPLEKTHDLNRLALGLGEYQSTLQNAATPLCKALADLYFVDRYPGFDLDDPDWPMLRARVAEIELLLRQAEAQLANP